ncbi:MAG: ABC transporter permease [Planctomycetaceae bacterium]|jgi:putative ABC transport system permease protein|nr:ABC transporter permease [Planctomycetaceae bacterium]
MRALPFDYAIRNLGRRPMRTLLTGLSSALVAALLVATTAFVRGLGGTFSGAAQSDTAILLSTVAERDVVRSTVTAGLPELVSASVPGVRQIGGVPAISAEIHMGTNLRLGEGPDAPGAEPLAGFVRGVTERAFLVHEAVTLLEGRPPRTGEVIVGRLVAAQLGVPEQELALGRKLRFEGATFEIVGRFAAPGTTIEAEIWTPLAELRGLTKRDDSSVAFVRMESAAGFPDLELFTRRRLDLELTMIPSSTYYRELSDYFAPIRSMAWAMAALIVAGALFGGANTLNAAVQDRLKELAALRAVGYSGLALVRSLAQESLVLAAGGGLVGLLLARIFLAGSSVRIAMSAFSLAVDAPAILVGFAGALLLGLIGTAPAAVRVLRLPIAAALKEP